MIRRWIGPAAMAALVAIWLWGAASVWPDAIARVVHPGWYATSGHATRDPAAYVAAARAALPPGARLVRLALPERSGPVIVTATSAARTDVYLDPPTARVLATAGSGTAPASSPPEPAQPVASVIRRARPFAGGGALSAIDWPTAHSPDWTVSFGGAGGTQVKVADDSPEARAAPVRQDEAARLLRSLRVGSARDRRVGMALAGTVLALACVAMAWRRRKQR